MPERAVLRWLRYHSDEILRVITQKQGRLAKRWERSDDQRADPIGANRQVRIRVDPLDQAVYRMEMQMPVCADLPSDTEGFGHSVGFDELRVPEDCFQAISQPACDDLSTRQDARETEVARTVARGPA